MRKLIMLSLTIILMACSNSPSTKNPSPAPIMPYGKPIKPDMSQVSKHPLGSKDNPIRVSGPSGERKYLSELICNNGEPVSAYSRAGSAGTGPYGSILDIYIVICDTDKGVVEHSVFMDMYHRDYIETRPAHGFKALTD